MSSENFEGALLEIIYRISEVYHMIQGQICWEVDLMIY